MALVANWSWQAQHCRFDCKPFLVEFEIESQLRASCHEIADQIKSWFWVKQRLRKRERLSWQHTTQEPLWVLLAGFCFHESQLMLAQCSQSTQIQVHLILLAHPKLGLLKTLFQRVTDYLSFGLCQPRPAWCYFDSVLPGLFGLT